MQIQIQSQIPIQIQMLFQIQNPDTDPDSDPDSCAELDWHRYLGTSRPLHSRVDSILAAPIVAFPLSLSRSP